MIVVGVGDEHEVDGGKLADGEGGGEVATGAACDETEADADAVAENGIGEEGHVADTEEDGGVAQPGGGEGLVLPIAEVGFERGGRRGVEMIEPAGAASAFAEEIGEAQDGVASFDSVCDFTPTQFSFDSLLDLCADGKMIAGVLSQAVVFDPCGFDAGLWHGVGENVIDALTWKLGCEGALHPRILRLR